MHFLPAISPELIKAYQEEVSRISPAATAKRKLASLNKFLNWAGQEDKTIPAKATPGHRPYGPEAAGKSKLGKWYKGYRSIPGTLYLSVAIALILASALGLGIYNQFFKNAQSPFASFTQTRPNRYLSFQGRLTSPSGNPITEGKSLAFTLYDDPTAGTTLWTGTCTVSPDTDGVFSTLLGSGGCGTELTSDIFSQNAGVWLGVKVATDAEATPRVQIATVAYALNSETLQGFPIDATGSATINTVVTMNSGGQIVIAESAPKIKSVSGTFAIEGQALTLTTPTASNGNVTISPNGTGQLNLTFAGASPGSGTGMVNATDANLTSGSLYYGSVNSDASGYNLLQLQSGATPADKFLVNSAGDTTIAGNLNANGNTTLGNAITDTLTFTARVAQDADLIPIGTTGTNDLGASALPWDNVYGITLYQNGNGVCDTTGNCTGSAIVKWRENLGTLSPYSDSLDVLIGSNATASAKFAFKNVLTGTPTASISANSGSIATYLTGDGTLATTNRQNLTIGNSATYNTTGNILLNPNGIGNVGIGTTSPASSLQVVGSTTNLLFVDRNDDAAGAASMKMRKIRGTSIVQGGDYIYSMEGWGYDGAAYRRGSYIASLVNGTPSSGVMPTELAFAVNSGGTDATERMRIDKNGNVGIGTTAPTAVLDVAGAASVSGTLSFRTGTGTIQTTNFSPLVIGGATTGNITLNPSNHIAGGYVAPNTTNVSDLGTASLLWRNVYGTTVYQGSNQVCDTSGNCTAATDVWSVANGAYIQKYQTADLLLGSSATSSARFAFIGVNTGGTPTASISGTVANVATFLDGNGNLSTTNRQNLTLGNSASYNSTGNILLNPNGTGNVGIGTTAPGATLEVKTLAVASTAETLAKFSVSDNAANYFAIQSNTATDGEFDPAFVGYNASSGRTGLQFIGSILSTKDSGSIPVVSFQAKLSTNAVVATRPLFDFTNYGTSVMRILASGNVGIGTTNPATPIEFYRAGGSGGGQFNVDNIMTGSNTDMTYTPNPNTTGTGGHAFYVDNGAAVSFAMGINHDGNVGIGTTAPTAMLDVAGAASVSGTLTFRTGTGTIQTTNFSPLVIGGDTTGNITLNPSNHIAGGYVAPNTTNVSDLGTASLLWRNVYGTTVYQGSNQVCDTSGNCTATTDVWSVANGAYIQKYQTADLLLGSSATSSAKFAFKGINTGGTPTASISGTVANVATFLDGNGNLSTTNRQNLTLGNSASYNSTGNILLNPNGTGNVGIGTTIPYAPLQVGTGTNTHTMGAGDAFVTSDLELDGILYLDGGQIANSAGTASILLSSTPTTTPNTLSAGSWLIENTANLGQAALMVNQTLGGDIFTASASGVPKFTITNSGVVNIAGLATSSGIYTDASKNLTSTAPTSGQLGYWTRSGTYLYNTNQGDNVGIGTTNPTNPLHISSSSNSVFNLFIENIGGDGKGLDVLSSYGSVGGAGTIAQFRDSLGTRMYIQEGGKVGIGTTAPAKKLEIVNSGLMISGSTQVESFPDEARLIVDSGGSTAHTLMNLRNDNGSTLWVGGDKVGIGTTAPQQDLDVNGVIAAGNTTDGISLRLNGTVGEMLGINTSYSAYNPIEIRAQAATQLYLSTTGNVGIGTTNPTTKLYVAGTTWSTTGWSSSDIRWKKNIQPITNSLDTILKLSGVSFNWREDEFPQNGFDDKTHLGFIAQEVEKIVPELVFTDTNGYKGLDYNGFSALLINAVGEQQGQIASLSGQLAGMNLTDTGDLVIKKLDVGGLKIDNEVGNGSSIFDQTSVFKLQTSAGEVIDRIGAFGQMVAANIKAGYIETQLLIADGLQTTAATIGQLIANNIQTKLISPLADESDVTVRLGNTSSTGSTGKLSIQNADGTEVASIDSSGSATFASATISGTLFAGDIKSKSLDEIQALLTQVTTDQNLLKDAANWNVNTASDSAKLDQLAVLDLYVTNQAAVNSLSVTNNFSVGSDFVITNTSGEPGLTPEVSINSLSAPLRIQSLAMAPVEIMGGLVSIDTHGNMQIAGNLAVGGNLNVTGRTTSVGLTLKDNRDVQGTTLYISDATASASLLSLQDSNGSQVASVNASGSAQFSNLSTLGLTIAGAQNATASAIVDGVITTNATAGSAAVPAGMSEITIKNPKVTDYTLVYVTPTSSTKNNVLFVKSKETGKFVVGFTDALDVDVSLNWWVIQVSQ